MNERYLRLFELQKNLYFKGSPIVIEAGALLKDNQKNRILTQLKILNIVDKTILAVKVLITGKDVFNNIVEEKEFHYLDINASRNQEFGQQTPIILSCDNIRSFSVEIIEIIYSDNTKWENNGNVFSNMPEIKTLSDFLKDDKLVEQYNINNGEGCTFAPVEIEDIWICTCGCVNYSHENTCYCCNRNKIEIISNLNLHRLKDEYINTTKLRNYEQATKLLSEGTLASVQKSRGLYENLGDYKDSEIKINECNNSIKLLTDKRKRKNTVCFIATLSFVVVCATIVCFKIIIPNYKYNNAMDYFNSGNYSKAIQLFKSLGNYKDSKNKVCEVTNEEKYQLAIELNVLKEYEQAIDIFTELDEYKDSKNYIDFCNVFKWYNEEFENEDINDEVVLRKLIKNVEILRKVDSEIGEECSDSILACVYDNCKTSKKNRSYLNYGIKLDFLIDNGFNVDKCKKMKNDYESHFSQTGLYFIEDSDNYYHSYSIDVTVDFRHGRIDIKDYSTDTFVLNYDNVYTIEGDDYLFKYSFSNNKLIYTFKGNGVSDTITYIND